MLKFPYQKFPKNQKNIFHIILGVFLSNVLTKQRFLDMLYYVLRQNKYVCHHTKKQTVFFTLNGILLWTYLSFITNVGHDAQICLFHHLLKIYRLSKKNIFYIYTKWFKCYLLISMFTKRLMAELTDVS